jgi:hypothetical protein
MSSAIYFYIQYSHPLDSILDSEGHLIGRSKLVENLVPFFGKNYLHVELGDKNAYKCIFPGFSILN